MITLSSIDCDVNVFGGRERLWQPVKPAICDLRHLRCSFLCGTQLFCSALWLCFAEFSFAAQNKFSVHSNAHGVREKSCCAPVLFLNFRGLNLDPTFINSTHLEPLKFSQTGDVARALTLLRADTLAVVMVDIDAIWKIQTHIHWNNPTENNLSQICKYRAAHLALGLHQNATPYHRSSKLEPAISSLFS